MRIEEVVIKGFGKWEQTRFSFAPGINLLVDHNESGKTTLLEAIIALLYGLKRDYVRKNLKLETWERYRPWGRGTYGGSIRYSIQGKVYQLERDLETDEHNLYDHHNFRELTKLYRMDGRKERPFILQEIGLSRTLFEEITRIGSLQVEHSDHVLEWLHQRNGETTSSAYHEVFSLLEKKKREIGRSDFGKETQMARGFQTLRERKKALLQGRKDIERLHILEARRKKLIDELSLLQNEREKITEANLKLKALKEEVLKLEHLQDLLSEWFEVHQTWLAHKEKYSELMGKLPKLPEPKWYSQASEEDWQAFLVVFQNWIRAEDWLIQQGELEKEHIRHTNLKEKLFSLKKKRRNLGVLSGAMGIITFTSFTLLPLPWWVRVILLVLCFVSGSAFLILRLAPLEKEYETRLARHQQGIIRYGERIADRDYWEGKLIEWFARFRISIPRDLWVEEILHGQQRRVSHIKQEKIKRDVEYSIKYHQESGLRIHDRKKRIEERIKEKGLLRDKEVFTEADLRSLSEKLIQAKVSKNFALEQFRSLEDNLTEISKIEHELARIDGEMAIYAGLNLAELENQYEVALELVNGLERKQRILERAKELFMETLDEWNREYSPEINRQTSEIFSILTTGKYEEVKVDLRNRFSLHVLERLSNDIRFQKDLSNGTQQQLQLSLRLALIKSYSEKVFLPIFFDDSFNHYDRVRLEKALCYLAKLAENHQIFLFSCQDREQKIFDDLQIKYSLIKAEKGSYQV